MTRRLLKVETDPADTVRRYHRWPASLETPTPTTIWFQEEAYRAAHRHATRGCLEAEGGEQAERRLEVKGALLGVPAQVGDALQIWVHAAVPLPLLAGDGPTWCVYRAEDKVKIDLLCEREFGGLQVVGWFHSHPNLGVFLSDVDVETMEHSFPLAHHVALVIDPVQDHASFFVWEEGTIDQAPREGFRPSSIIDEGEGI